MFNIDTLCQIPLFSSLSIEQLRGVLQLSEILVVRQGEVFIREGDEAGDFFVLLSGNVEFRTKQLRDREVHFISYGPSDFFGHELILVGDPLYLGSGYALCDSDLLKLEKSAFWEMISNCPTIIQKLLRTNAQRWQSYEALLQSQAKLSSLGTLAAGLAHELNNPAAAVLRSAEHLNDISMASSSWLLKLSQKSLTNEQMTFLDDLQRRLNALIKTKPQLNPLAQSTLEDNITNWLEEQGISNSWELAASFVAAGLDNQDLQQVASHIPSNALAEVLTWLEATLNQTILMIEIKEGASRIAHLVQAVKDYSYMDQAPLQEIDIQEGIENTLDILAHKFTPEISISREYAVDLPQICAYGSALNQVWTEIVNNAIDAMAGQGQLRIRTAHSGSQLIVEITDSGAGIPLDIQAQVFDPFFTTKAVGEGTGLGLDIARRIIVSQHRGDIQFVSQPGETTFRVRLPIVQENQH